MLEVPFDDQQKDAGCVRHRQEGRRCLEVFASTGSTEETQRSVCVLKRDIL